MRPTRCTASSRVAAQRRVSSRTEFAPTARAAAKTGDNGRMNSSVISPSAKPGAASVWIALAIVYVVWGSTYLAIRFGVEAAPPYLFASARFVIAAAAMLLYAWARGLRFPATGRELKVIAITGALLLGGANGLVTWSEQWVASNQAALMVATSALWMAWIGSVGPRGEPLSQATWAGLLLGFIGVAVLVGDGLLKHSGPVGAYVALIVSPLMWAGGSIYARRNPVSCSPTVTAGLQMLVASLLLGLIGLALNEPAHWRWNNQAWAALAYLAVFGSIIGYGAYFYLVHNAAPALLGTYAYVNPAVAVLLGCWLAGEPFTHMQAAGTAVILVGVVVVTLAQRRGRVAAVTR